MFFGEEQEFKADRKELYAAYRPSIRTGDILAWKATEGTSFFDNIFAKTIRVVTGHPIHHVAVAFRANERVFVVEAMPPFIRIFPLDRRGTFYTIPMGLEESYSLGTRILVDVGEVYSMVDALRSYGKITLRVDNGFQCVEETKGVLEDYDITVPDTFLPGEFMDYMRQGREVIKVIN